MYTYKCPYPAFNTQHSAECLSFFFFFFLHFDVALQHHNGVLPLEPGLLITKNSQLQLKPYVSDCAAVFLSGPAFSVMLH